MKQDKLIIAAERKTVLNKGIHKIKIIELFLILESELLKKNNSTKIKK